LRRRIDPRGNRLTKGEGLFLPFLLRPGPGNRFMIPSVRKGCIPLVKGQCGEAVRPRPSVNIDKGGRPGLFIGAMAFFSA
jgi:hypothetical protein